MSAPGIDTARLQALCAAFNIQTRLVTDTNGHPHVDISARDLHTLTAAGLLPDNPTCHAQQHSGGTA